MVCRAIREVGGVCIADEVQTGLGRTGDYFWGFEAHGMLHTAFVEESLLAHVSRNNLKLSMFYLVCY